MNQLLFRYENEDNPCDPKNEPPPFLAAVLNFAIFGLLIAKFGQKPVSDALVKRRATIMADIENAARLKDEAESRLGEYKSKFKRLNEKLEEMRADYQAQGKAEQNRILQEAEERRTRMRRDAEFRIEQELKAARLDVLRGAVLASTKAAEELLQKKVVAGDHERLAEAYLKRFAVAASPSTRTFEGGASS